MSAESTRGKPPMSGPEMDDMALRGGRDACAALAKKGLEAGADHMDIAAEEFCASRLETMRSRLRTQRERLEALRNEMLARRNEDANVTVIVFMYKWLAALDEILNEEG